jgi:preprotein translocase subunit SecE
MNEEKKPSKKKEASEGGDNVVRGVYQTYKAEFRKIVWPSRETLIKHTVTVIAVSLIFGAYIALADGAFGVLFNEFVNLVGDGPPVFEAVDPMQGIQMEILP